MEDSKIGVALVNHSCFLCGHKTEEIIMNTILSENRAKEIEKLHGKTVGHNICETCEKALEVGIGLIEVDESKTTDRNNPWRTGRICVIKESAFDEIFNKDVDKSKRIIYIPIEVSETIGLFKTK